VTAVSASAERGARLRELGAADVVADVEHAAGPFEVAIESVGGLVTTAAWHSLEPHGLLIWLGQASGAPPRLDYFDWGGAMSVTIRKFDYLDSTHTEAADLATLVRLVAGGVCIRRSAFWTTGRALASRSTLCSRARCAETPCSRSATPAAHGQPSTVGQLSSVIRDPGRLLRDRTHLP
jgi:hypothetical protein